MTQTDPARWYDNARLEAAHARRNLGEINTESDQVAHSQAENILVGFIRNIGFTDLADKFENIRAQRGFTYSEQR